MTSSPIEVLLNLAASAALLVWAVRLVRTGFERAFGSQLRLLLRRSTGNRIYSAATGFSAAVLLQSSTAVAVLLSGFMATGSINASAGLAILLGADLGSALVVQFLNSGISALTPLLLLCGVLTFLRSSRRTSRQIGRILIGFALIFVSLQMIRDASAPLQTSEAARTAMTYLANDLVSAFLIATVFAWVVHSSVAAVLLFAALAGQGLLPLGAAFAMVLGANLGGGLIAFGLTMGSAISVRQVVLANLLLRGGGAALVLLALARMDMAAQIPGGSPTQQALNLHLLFNLGLLFVGALLVRPSLWITRQILTETNGPDTETGHQSLLDPAVQNQPARAFACAQRELVEIGNRVEKMLRDAMPLFDRYDATVATRLRDHTTQIAQTSLDLRVYLSRVRSDDQRIDTGKRAFELAGTAANIEAAADVIGRNLGDLARRKHDQQVKFSEEGWRELTEFHDRVLRNIQHGVTVLMTEDIGLARDLVSQKEKIRDFEQALGKKHLTRLRNGSVDSVETSSIHLELLRALKALNTSFALIAYPLLTKNGELMESRLASGPAQRPEGRDAPHRPMGTEPSF